MKSSKMTFAVVIAFTAVFALGVPVDMAIAQTSSALPDGEGGEYKDGEHKEGKSCPFKERTLQFQEQFT